MAVTRALKWTSLIVLVISILVVTLEKYIPDLSEEINLEDLPDELKSWFNRGELHNVYGRKMFAVYSGQKEKLQNEEVIILIHGFPASSFDYHRSIHHLESSGRPILVFDHIGFGFSEKPDEGFVYSLHEHAENALELWRKLGIQRAHLVAHDMGDSILTEILTRRQKKMLPNYFDNFFKSVTFSNGGMHYDLINFRASQVLLRVPYIGTFLANLSSKLPPSVTNWISRKQLLSIWGPLDDPEYQVAERDFDIDSMILLIRLHEGNKISHKTITYLNDRYRYETRWYAALSKLDLPCLLLWGDSDAVSPMEIPKYLAKNVLPSKLVTGVTLMRTGHFLMLEKPSLWAKKVLEFIDKNG